MKKICIAIFAILAISQSSFAQSQWTTSGNNIFNTNTGNVGIGLSSPLSKLQISTSALAGVTVTGNTSSFIGPDIGISRATSGASIGTAPAIQFTDVATGFSSMIQSYHGQLQFFNNIGSGWSEWMRITTTAVGIGTIAPISMFQVATGCRKSSLGSAGATDLNYGTSYLGFNAARNAGTWTVESDGLHNGGGVIYGDVFGDIYFAPIPTGTAGGAGGATQTLADSSVKKLIAFSVSSLGVARAKQVVVQLTGWPDYVFKPNYLLRQLTDVKSYVAVNHHLPDMPSESQIAADGLNLGEMDKLLTKKVEELTLYLIEGDKKEQQQQTQIDVQAGQLKLQQQEIDQLKQQLQLLLKNTPGNKR
ncbi:hypothetical protein SAMN05216490_0135 [Mucilaginibacter mallensis]|uniref:Uncharacterized protein n=1 Tax=Mucilaginibacter mallensis TaxID=652787 RepID=A0A1H1MPZ3_MUCMA|nr:hypothetical protein [Mucilaginibacter mallensis]SDR88854.1 hypothetical protein SAMN05216490_0135 [Mucilaginibacter mallensis]